MPLLEVDGIQAAYGRTRVLHGVSFGMNEGEITALLGANAAGKTTTLRAITGMVKTSGGLRFDGKSIAGRPTEDIVRLGIAHVPEGRGTFVGLTVDENLKMGAYTRHDKLRIAEDMERVYTYFPRLRQRHQQVAGTLSGGEQQMLSMARGLMLRPRLMLLDEPSLGLAPLIVREIFHIVKTINETDRVTILLVEQNATIALDVAHHAYLIETGRVVMSGAAATLKADESIRRVYLGH
jgi:branched-chain amino acid transport system ATP-binding protein